MSNVNKYKELLEVGQIYKNYKVLCEHLNEEAKTSTSKTAHTKKWRRCFDFKTKGHKIIITEIHDEVKDNTGNWKGGNNAVKYIDVIEKLLLDLLARQKSEHVFISKGNLLKALKMINSDYGKNKFSINKLSKEIEIDAHEIKDFYSTSDSVLQSNLETTLRRLDNKALIKWNKAITVGVVQSNIQTIKKEVSDEYGDISSEFHLVNPTKNIIHRKATPIERSNISRAEKDVLTELGYDEKYEVFRSGKRDMYYKKVNNLLFDRYNIYLYYSSYEITFNEDHIQEEAEKQSYKLIDFLRQQAQMELNDGVVSRLTNNADNRKQNASAKYEETKKDVYRSRMSFSYLENFDRLVDKLVKVDFIIKDASETL